MFTSKRFAPLECCIVGYRLLRLLVIVTTECNSYRSRVEIDGLAGNRRKSHFVLHSIYSSLVAVCGTDTITELRYCCCPRKSGVLKRSHLCCEVEYLAIWADCCTAAECPWEESLEWMASSTLCLKWLLSAVVKYLAIGWTTRFTRLLLPVLANGTIFMPRCRRGLVQSTIH